MPAPALQSPNNPNALAAGPSYAPLPVNGLVSPAVTFGTPALPSTATKTVVTAKPAVADMQAKQANVTAAATAMAAPKTTTDISSFTPAQQQAFLAAAGLSNGNASATGAAPAATSAQTQTPTPTGNPTADQLAKMAASGQVKLTPEQQAQVDSLQQNPNATTQTQPPTTGDPQQDYINSQRTSLDQQAQTNYDNYTSQLQQIANGSFPLTQSQQAQLNALQSQFDALKQQQITANANYTGAVTNLGIRAGRSRYAPEIEQSNIQSAINLGLSKINDINAQAATSIAQLQQGFADNDYKLINAQYSALQDLMKEKDNSLQEMQQSIKDQMDAQAQKLTQQKTLMDIETSTINNVAQAAFTNALNDDGSLNFDNIQQTADDYGVDVNQLYSAILKQKDDYTQEQQGEQKFQTDQAQAAATLANTQANTRKTNNDISAANSGGGAGGAPSAAVTSWVSQIQNGNATLTNVPAAMRTSVAVALSSTPQTSYSPLASSRFATASNRIVSNFTNLPQYQLTANGLPYLQRIDAAMKNPGSVSDQDLLDSLTKLNTAGNAISDAQVKIITDGKSFSDTINAFGQKFKNGGVLSDNQRQQIQSIAQNIYANYAKGYQPVYDQVTKQLTDAGIPEAFWTIPDLNNLSGQQGGAGDDSSGFTPRGSTGANDFVANTFATKYPGQTEQQVLDQYNPSLQKGEQVAFDNDTGDIVAATAADIASGKYTPI